MIIKTRQQLIQLYLDFFKSKNHKIIPSSSLIPENDPTVLFTTAGMHPLVPFLLGQKHPLGKRLADVQKCIRTQDIDEVGDTTHHTFFEMLGNWSLGDYFKEEAIEYSFEFLTKTLKIPKENLAVTCFAGDKDAEKDNESAKIWQSLGINKERIAFLGKEDNWWGPAGQTGPCGPDTEMFFYIKGKSPAKFNPKDKNWVEIWNDVFMQYNKNQESKYLQLQSKNVDTGMGVERTLAVLNGLNDNYETSIFQPIIKEIEKISHKSYSDEKNKKAMRIIADHIRAAVFILGDEHGIKPSNIQQGYVLRRLIRRAIRYGKLLGIKSNFTAQIAKSVIPIYPDYPELKRNDKLILQELEQEETRFNQTLEEGLKITEKLFATKTPIEKGKYIKLMQLENKKEIFKELWQKKREDRDYSIKKANLSEKEIDNAIITEQEAFLLYQSYGFPMEMILELAQEKRLIFHRGGFKREFEKHQELSRTASAGMFKSGLADNSETTKKLHTATHLLNEVLRIVLKDKNIKQKGSNITPERLRFDFNFPRKLTDEEIKEIENLVNKKIKEKLKVTREEMPLNKALASGAQAEFGAKYPNIEGFMKLSIFNPPVEKSFCFMSN